MGLIYLLHFERSYHHARHYLGYTDDLEARVAAHRAGRGVPLLPLRLLSHLKRSWTPSSFPRDNLLDPDDWSRGGRS